MPYVWRCQISYNGSGTFNINTAGQPVVTGTVISSTAFNALTADLGTGLSTALTKDGQTVATARIPFAAGINSSLVTDATSTTTGSIITAGGVGIAKALYVGTTANIAGTTTLAGVTATSITDSGLTSGRVTYAGTAGLLQDSANLTFNGTTLTANTIGAFTLSGTVAGGGNQLNNVIIGTTTPLAGAFTTLSSSGAYTATANIGITRTPLSSTSSVLKTLEIGTAGTATTTFFGQTNVSAGGISTNSIFDASNNYVYATSAAVSNLYMYNGSTKVQYAASGTAGNTFTLTTIGEFSSTGLAVTGTLSATTTGKVGTTLGVGAATPSASGAGITFPATQSASSDANTLDDYEEGTWTPSDQSGAGLTFTVSFAKYTKVGRAVSIQGTITYPTTASTATAQFAGFPFNADDSIQMSLIYTDASVATFTYLSGNQSNVFPLIPRANVTNATLSGKIISFAGTYFV